MKSVTLRLRQIMSEQGLSQSDIVRLTGIHSSILSQLVNGTKKQISFDSIVKLAKGLHVDINELMEGCPIKADSSYVEIIREFEKEGVTVERLWELLEWVKKISPRP